MAEYNPLKDKYMKYMIPSSVVNLVKKQLQKKGVDKEEFQQFLEEQKRRALKTQEEMRGRQI